MSLPPGTGPSSPRQQSLRTLAAALEGNREALAALAAEPAAADLARRHRAGPALALRAKALGVKGPAVAAWHRSLIAMAAHRLRVEDRLGAAAAALAGAEVPWVLLKGCDLGSRVYAEPEERPVGDIDLLIAAADLDPARAALAAAGWRGLFPGERSERYLRDEGYAWQAVDATGLLLEVHVRLWGLAPAGLAPALLAAAQPDPALGAAGRRLPLAHAWLVAAVHAWLTPRPRPLLSWWDLERIAAAAGPELTGRAVRLAEQWDLQLPAALAAAEAARLWGKGEGGRCHREAAARLLDRLRPPERLVARRALESEDGAGDLPLERIVLARLLSGRASRAGWRSLPRQVWAHPGVVEQETPAGRSWPRRRLAHALHLLWPR